MYTVTLPDPRKTGEAAHYIIVALGQRDAIETARSIIAGGTSRMIQLPANADDFMEQYVKTAPKVPEWVWMWASDAPNGKTWMYRPRAIVECKTSPVIGNLTLTWRKCTWGPPHTVTLPVWRYYEGL